MVGLRSKIWQRPFFGMMSALVICLTCQHLFANSALRPLSEELVTPGDSYIYNTYHPFYSYMKKPDLDEYLVKHYGSFSLLLTEFPSQIMLLDREEFQTRRLIKLALSLIFKNKNSEKFCDLPFRSEKDRAHFFGLQEEEMRELLEETGAETSCKLVSTPDGLWISEQRLFQLIIYNDKDYPLLHRDKDYPLFSWTDTGLKTVLFLDLEVDTLQTIAEDLVHEFVMSLDAFTWSTVPSPPVSSKQRAQILKDPILQLALASLRAENLVNQFFGRPFQSLCSWDRRKVEDWASLLIDLRTNEFGPLVRTSQDWLSNPQPLTDADLKVSFRLLEELQKTANGRELCRSLSETSLITTGQIQGRSGPRAKMTGGGS